MRLRLGVAAGFALVVGCVAAAVAEAGFRPSFDLESCTRRATHIVVVTEGEKIDGHVQVLESWKGDLHPADALDLPELAAFEEDGTRAIHAGRSEPEEQGKHVTGLRMVLFLKRVSGTTAADSTWATTNTESDELKYSTVWIEGGEAYAFAQIGNPGDSLLVGHGTEARLHEEMSRVDAEWGGLQKALAIVDPLERAKALEPYALSKSWDQAEAAFAGLGKCGTSGLPVIRAMLTDARFAGRRSYVVGPFAKAGGVDVAPELTAILVSELAFWKVKGPSLPMEWWGAKCDDEVSPESHFGLCVDTLTALEPMRHAPSESVVTELRDFWLSVPQLKSHEQITEGCDRLLRVLHEPPVAKSEDAPEEKKPESVPVMVVVEVPLTTADDVKRLDELEATLAVDLAAERATRTPTRGVLRGQASADEVSASLREAVSAVVSLSTEDRRFFEGFVAQPFSLVPSAARSERFQKARAQLRPNLELVARALAAEKLAPWLDVAKEWTTLLTIPEPPFSHSGEAASLAGLRSAFVFESIAALDSGDAARAAQLALDLWRVDQDVRRDTAVLLDRRPADSDGDPGQLLAAAIPGLDAAALAEVGRELAILESTTPSFAAEVRQRRLAYACFLRAYHRGELKSPRSDEPFGEREADVTPLDHLSARARLRDRRVGSIRRVWEQIDRIFQPFEESAAALRPLPAPINEAPLPPCYWVPAWSDEPWTKSLSEALDRSLGEIARIRLLRVLTLAQTFRLGHGRWPKDVAEAVGDKAATRTDPFTGAAFTLVSGEDGSLRATLEPRAGSTEAARAYGLLPR